MTGATLETSPAQDDVSYLTQAIDNRKLMSEEAAMHSFKFRNSDTKLSEVLESLPDFEGGLKFSDEDIF